VLLLALALAVTLSSKLLVRDTATANDLDDSVVAFLTRHQFQARRMPGVNRIDASSGDCRLVIRLMFPQGYNLDGIKTSGAQEGRLFFVYKGLVYADPPFARIRLSYYWTRLQQKLGLDTERNPALAVASSESCSLDALPWTEIAELP
jgi:hypothetical protein